MVLMALMGREVQRYTSEWAHLCSNIHPYYLCRVLKVTQEIRVSMVRMVKE